MGGGGGGLDPGGQDPLPYWGTPKLHKEENKSTANVRECAAFLYLTVGQTSNILYLALAGGGVPVLFCQQFNVKPKTKVP